ncbi:MAG: SRPBCC family protein [Kaiparowitsia implicata GSE-PSE-MK54-09C]|jgi:hypothetical protein|nr:SRPBCC family protein [Kaiparowitsia implicata GSE-PSE-MK54-09C]
MIGCWFKQSHRAENRWVQPLVETYHAVSTASVDELWLKVTNLADMSWHPIIASTNVPQGLIPKPGLIYKAFTRLLPIFPVQIFVERVLPRQLLSIRVLALPGVEEHITYRVESTLCGTQVSYSVTLRGWLSPLVWSLTRRYAARVAAELAQAAEEADPNSVPSLKPSTRRSAYPDLFAAIALSLGLGTLLSQMPQSPMF